MRILHITPSFQHPQVRGPDRHYYFVRGLSKNHDITLLTLGRSEIPAKAMEEMTDYTEQVMVLYTNGASSHGSGTRKSLNNGGRLHRTWHSQRGVRQMKRAFREQVLNQPYDVVLFQGKSVYPVIASWNELPLVIDFCDATSLRIQNRRQYVGKAKQFLLGLRYLQMRRTEKAMVQKTPHLAFISCRDRAAILGPNDKSAIVPNGIDLQYWQRKKDNISPNRLVFTGVMSYAPNEDAVLHLIDDILPLLEYSIPDIEIMIVGREPTAALKEKAAHHPQVTVTGFVDDIRPYLEQATVFVAPLRYGAGQQNKILEAMAMELPVITTPVAADGVRVEHSDQLPICIAEGAQEFTDNILFLLEHPTERVRLARLGRQYVENHFEWLRVTEAIERICLEAVESKR